MTTATQTVTKERRELHQAVDALPNESIPKLADYVKWLAEEAEIAALEAKYGTTPNAETIAAMMEAESGGGEQFSSIEDLMAELHDENDD
jgi:hypothetical protein